MRAGCGDYLVADQCVGRQQFEATRKIYLPTFPFALGGTQGFTKCEIVGCLDTDDEGPGPMFLSIYQINFPQHEVSEEMEDFIDNLRNE